MTEFSSQFAGFLWNMLCHSLWSVPLIGWIFAARFESLSPCRRESRLRRAVATCLVIPSMIALAQATFETESATFRPRSEGSASPIVPTALTSITTANSSGIAIKPVRSESTAFLISLRNAIGKAAPWAIFAWFSGMILLSVRLFLGGIVFRNRFGTCEADARMQSMANALAQRLHMSRSPDVRISKSVDQPMVTGLLRPVVILPEFWPNEAASEQLEAVLAHEIAHVRRSDLRNRLIERTAAILWFFHPAMHRLIRNAALWREIAADRLAVSATGNPLALAHALESFAIRAGTRRSKSAAEFAGLPLLAARRPGHLVTRIEAILGASVSRPSKFERRMRWAIGASLLILGGITLFLVQSRPFASGPNYRPALAIGGTANVTVGDFDPAATKIVYEVRLVNVDTQFAGESLRAASKLPQGQVLPDQFVIGQELTRTLTSHSTASSMLFPRVTASDGASVECRWEAPNLPKIATIELNGRPVPDKIRNEKVWTVLQLAGRSEANGVELRSGVTDYHDRLKIEKKPVPGSPSPAMYGVSVTEERKSNGSLTLKPGESLCVRLGESIEPYRKEPRFLYETVLGEKGTRVSQFVRLAIVTARAADEGAE